MFNRVTIVPQLHTCLQSNFSVECRYRKKVITITTVLPHHIYRPNGTALKISPSHR